MKNDDAKPVEPKPAEAKPVEPKPAEAKPVEPKPAEPDAFAAAQARRLRAQREFFATPHAQRTRPDLIAAIEQAEDEVRAALATGQRTG